MVTTAIAGVNTTLVDSPASFGSTSSTTPIAQRIRLLDSTQNLQSTMRLDVSGDGRLDAADADALDRLARSAAYHARNAVPGTAADGNVFADINVTSRGGLDPAGRSKQQLMALARQLGWAASQARTGAALVRPPGDSTLHNAHNVSSTLTGTLGPRDVIAAIDQLDADALRAHGGRTTAAFDVDGTSMKGDIFIPVMSEVALRGRFGEHANTVFRDLLARKQVDQKLVAQNDANANARLLVSLTDAAAANGAAGKVSIFELFSAFGSSIKGMKLDDLRGDVRTVLTKGTPGFPAWRSNINDDSSGPGDSVIDMTRALKAKKITPWVVTWGFDWIAKEAAPYLGISRANVVGSHSDVAGGVFTGGTTTASKHDMVVDYLKSTPIFVYGDSSSDAPMWDLALGRGFIVNASDKMKALNEARGKDLSELRYRTTVGNT